MRHAGIFGLLLLGACEAPPAGAPTPDPAEHRVFRAEVDCAGCHPRQVDEFAVATMRYGAFSPTFQAMEVALAEVFDAPFAGDRLGDARNFCGRCHAPLADARGVVADGTLLRPRLSHPTDSAVSCDFCHRVTGPDFEASTLGDGIGNLALAFAPGVLRVGPVNGAISNGFHTSADGDGAFLRSSAFCGACHDVRPPLLDVTRPEFGPGGAPFARSEDLFSEWQASPYADADHLQNPLRGMPGVAGIHGPEAAPRGEEITCQDCHMSRYPQVGFAAEVPAADFAGVPAEDLPRKADKLYRADRVAEAEGAPVRRVSTHALPGASSPMVPFPLRPELSAEAALASPPLAWFDAAPGDPVLAEDRALAEAVSRVGDAAACEGALDTGGLPACSRQRRVALLQAAVTLSADEVPAQVGAGGVLDIPLWVENVGAGHNVPAGFSQERETWVELSVIDEGAPCTADTDCADWLEARRFFEDPRTSCLPLRADGRPDPLYDPALPDSVDRRFRADRSGQCDPEARRCVIYRSGHLVDEDGDGRTADEDLRHRRVQTDPTRLREACVAPGPDADLRPAGVLQGLVWFHNGFQRVALDAEGAPVPEPQAERWLAPTAVPYAPGPDSPPVWAQDPAERRSLFATQRALYERVRYLGAETMDPDTGVTHRFGPEVPNLMQANRFFNGNALRPFEPRQARYQVTLPEAVVGPVAVRARVRFRFFSPRTLRTLAAREAQRDPTAPLVHEALIDQGLDVVDLAAVRAEVEVLRD